MNEYEYFCQCKKLSIWIALLILYIDILLYYIPIAELLKIFIKYLQILI